MTEQRLSGWEVQKGCESEVLRHMLVLVAAERNRHYSFVVGTRVVGMHCKQVVVQRLLVWARSQQMCRKKRREYRGLHCRQD
jgi:hypothetical protein